MRRGWRGQGQGAAMAFMAVLFLVVLPAFALVHQTLRFSEPADADVVEIVPETLRLTFTEPLRMEFTEVEVEGPAGRLVLGELRTAEEAAELLLVPVEAGWHAGEFVVRWRTVGADGHPSEGSFSITVPEGAEGLPADVDTVPAPEETHRLTPESPAYVAVRWATFVALIGMIGAVAFRGAVLPLVGRRRELREGTELRALVTDAARGAASLGLAAAVLFLAAGLARLWAQTAALFSVGDTLSPARWASTLEVQPWGAAWWLQAAGGAVAVVGFAVARRRGSRAGWVLAGLAALAASVTLPVSGHAVAVSDLAGLAVTADALHVIAAGGWVGGLALVLLAGVPAAARLGEGDRGPAVAALVRGFSPVALGFAAIVVGSGVTSAWIQLGAFPDLWTTPYGRTLLLKLALVAGVLAMGAYNKVRVQPGLGDEAGSGRIRRSGGVELAFAITVLVVTAVLVALPPPTH